MAIRREITAGGLLSPVQLPLLFGLLWLILSLFYGPVLAMSGAFGLIAVLAAGIRRVAAAPWFGRRSRQARTLLLAASLILLPAAMPGGLLVLTGVTPLFAVPCALLIALGAAGIHAVTPRRALGPRPRRRPPLRKPRPAPVPPAPRQPGAPDAVDHVRDVLRTRGPGAAVKLLRPVVTDPAVDPARALAVADEIVEAESARAESTYDDRPYAEAIGVLTDLITRWPGVPGGKALLHSHRAEYFTFQAARLADSANPDNDRLVALFAATERELRAAVRATPAGSAEWGRESARLGLLLCQGTDKDGRDRLDEGIALIRQAVDRSPPAQRAQGRLDLAEALIIQLHRRPGAADREEIEDLLARSVLDGQPSTDRADDLRADLGRCL